MLPALGSIVTQQANPIENNMNRSKPFLENDATRHDAIITYHGSNMVLAGHTNAAQKKSLRFMDLGLLNILLGVTVVI